MAEADFGFFGASAAETKRGVSAGFTPPNGGGSFVFGFNSQTEGDKASGVYYYPGHVVSSFAPLRNNDSEATGGSVRGALQRSSVSQAASGFSIALFCCLQGASAPGAGDTGYILGLSDDDPSFIVLAKGVPESPLNEASEDVQILAKSSASYLLGTWHHLRLDVIVNPNGDVVLNAYRSDLALHAVTTPTWAAIAGISS